MVDDLISGRDALRRLDELVRRAREDFDAAARSAEGAQSRRVRLSQLKADGYRELARMRLDALKGGAADRLSDAERQASERLDHHQVFVRALEADLQAADAELAAAETARQAAQSAADEALLAYERQAAATEARLKTDAGYQAQMARLEEARAVVTRAGQKQELALADRAAKGAPYLADPLFSYLWERRFRTSDYRGRGIVRALDGWVARVCGYDAAYLNFARLNELPDRLAEHAARMKLEEAEAEAALERMEAEALDADGAGRLAAAAAEARSALKAADDGLAAAEARRAQLRVRQEEAGRGEAGPLAEAQGLIQAGLADMSFPDLKLLAAQTTSLDDDQIVEALIKLRTEELQLEVAGKGASSLPARRRADADALETARRHFRAAGLDGPYVMLGRAAFEAATEAWGRGGGADGEKLFRAITATVRQAPGPDDHYFGGRRRRDVIGLPERLERDIGGVAGMIVGEVLREVVREVGRSHRRGRWDSDIWGGSLGDWGGGWSGRSPSDAPKSRGRRTDDDRDERDRGEAGDASRSGRRTTGRIGGGGFKTKDRF